MPDRIAQPSMQHANHSKVNVRRQVSSVRNGELGSKCLQIQICWLVLAKWQLLHRRACHAEAPRMTRTHATGICMSQRRKDSLDAFAHNCRLCTTFVPAFPDVCSSLINSVHHEIWAPFHDDVTATIWITRNALKQT